MKEVDISTSGYIGIGTNGRLGASPHLLSLLQILILHNSR
jgi:hypothetical protein